MNNKRKSQVIIGGADGPTSVFVVGHSGKQPLKNRIKNCIYRYRGKRAESRIFPVKNLSENIFVK